MLLAAILPEPMALITVASPVAMSPPAYTASKLVFPVFLSIAIMPPLNVSSPLVVA